MMKTSTPYPSKTTTAMATAKKVYLNAPHDFDIETDQPANMHEFLSEEPVMPAPNVASNNKTDGTTPSRGKSSHWSFPIPKEQEGRWICLLSVGLVAVLVVVIGSVLASGGGGGPSPSPSARAEVQVQVQYDDYPEETGWTLRDSTGTLISIQSTGSFNTPGGIVTKTSSVAPGTYTFEMTDTADDGICCEYGSGSFRIAVNGETVISNNGQFGDIVKETFEVAP
jgi:hypothetical protein